MSSDPSDPLNSTGSGMPVFGKIRKLGETEEEQVPEENFIPQEEYYDPDDFQQAASPQEQTQVSQEPILAPPASPSNLQVKRPQAPQPPGPGVPAPPQAPNSNLPHQLSGSDEESLKLKNRTAAHLEYNERAQKTQAQFDDYFEQEMKSEPGFIETYFKMEETFSAKARKIIAGIAAACIIFGIAISLESFFLNLFFSLVTFQAILVLSLQKGTLTKLGLFPGRVILAAVFALMFIIVPMSYKWWQEQGGEYIESFQHVEKLANDGQKAIKDGIKSTEGTTGEYIDSSAIATVDIKYAADMANKFDKATYLSGGGLLKMYLQFVFLLFGFTMLPFIKERNLLKVLYLRPENTKIHWKISRYFLVRLIKAVIIAGVFAVGLTVSGADSVIFIAGTTFVLTAISRFGPIAGLIMCIPVVVTQFKTGDGMTALIGLAITGLVAFMAESRLHWLMIILPLKDKGIIPPSMSKPKQQVIKVEGQKSDVIMKFLSLALTLGFYGGIAYGGWLVYGIWQNYSEVQKDIPRQVKKALGDGKSAAIGKLEKYQEGNPYDREILLSLTKAYLRAGATDKALKAAKDYRDFKSPEPDAEGLLDKGEQYVVKFLSKTNTKEKDTKALKWLISNFIELNPGKLDSDSLLYIIKEMQETDPDEMKTYEVAGYFYMAKANYELVRKWCLSGLAKDKENVELLKLIVKSHIAEKDRQRALRAMMNVDKVTTSDPELDSLNKQIRELD